MESILLVIHVIIALLIVGLIMLQQGKGAEMGASFGAGSSQTVFGAAGSGNFFSRMTGVLVAVFFATSFTLAVIAKNRVDVDDVIIPVVEKVTGEQVSTEEGEFPVLDDEVPASVDESDIPAIESEAADGNDASEAELEDDAKN